MNVVKIGQQQKSRTLLLLTICQALYLSAMSIDLTITALVGSSLAWSPTLSTVPMATIAVGSSIVAPFVSRLAARIGMKKTLILGSCTAVLGGGCSYLAVTYDNFILLCVGTLAVGIYQAVANYYRYVAADLQPGHEARNITIILSAGVAAAILGPFIARLTQDLLTPIYACSYLAVSILGVLAFLTLTRLPNGVTAGSGTRQPSSLPATYSNDVSIHDIITRPKFQIGALISVAGCFTMAIVMSGAPIELAIHLHADATARMFAMQLHMVGMYGPMLLIPLLSKRLAVIRQAIFGILLGLVGLLLSLYTSIPTMVCVLFFVGACWAVMYAAGSIYLTTSYADHERSTARGVGEFFPVFGLALGSIVAGPMIALTDWNTLAILCVAILSIVALITLKLLRSVK